MAAFESTRAGRAVNPTTAFELDILDLAEASLAVLPLLDVGGVEIRVKDHTGEPIRVLLAPRQAMAVATLLVHAVAAVDDAESRP
jgi:hypothetical protein